LADDGTWLYRTGVRLRGIGEYLRTHGGTANKSDILAWVAGLLEPNDDEKTLRSTGDPKWQNDVEWQSTTLVKAQWMTKDGTGVWTITPEGVQALDDHPEAADYHTEAIRRFNEWRRERDEKRVRRAWLIRGSSVRGVNLVPSWLREGFVSVSATQLGEPPRSVSLEELEAMAGEGYAHLNQHELRAKVEEIVSFVKRINPGDVVLTTSDQHVYVGDVNGDWSYAASEGGRSNLRRIVDWRNPDAPLDFSELPEPLPARLQTGVEVLNLTADLDLIDSLATPVEVLPTADSTPGLAPRHEQLAEPSHALAAELFVDQNWLQELRDLLNERRQIIFYGPPGTGKTYIARKFAADLVGPEQVKMVQFHPAYTYEDFFEGYRPAAGSSEGTISFELKAGPLRQLVNRAREHPDQAFVLIIDEINRANLAKVFGELYFLLEYRDQAVDLLYSSDDEGFTLPRNLYLIGTMNTADRSIALVDAAMRRRFGFIELSPDIEPTASLLADWSAHHGLGNTAADLLARLNKLIEDPDFRIGPAYFMKSSDPGAHSAERLERIWRTSILPLLQEHYYGEWESVQRRFQLSVLMSAAPEADAPVTEASPSTPGRDTVTDQAPHETGG
jgi:5-methylcytosine-specific restriction protein B